MEATSRRRVENICVFCGTSVGTKPVFVAAAHELGRVIAKRNMHLVYGGGNLGLMGIISKAVREGDSQVLGIIPKPLAEVNLIGPSNKSHWTIKQRGIDRIEYVREIGRDD